MRRIRWDGLDADYEEHEIAEVAAIIDGGIAATTREEKRAAINSVHVIHEMKALLGARMEAPPEPVPEQLALGAADAEWSPVTTTRFDHETGVVVPYMPNPDPNAPEGSEDLPIGVM